MATMNRCLACGQVFLPNPHVPNQRYCSNPMCQRERRRRWQHLKRLMDPDYRGNDADYRKAWSANHPEYWKRYRELHPDYTTRNRALQRNRNKKQRAARIAKVDASMPGPPLSTGRYRLIPVSVDGIAHGDGWMVEISVL